MTPTALFGQDGMRSPTPERHVVRGRGDIYTCVEPGRLAYAIAAVLVFVVLFVWSPFGGDSRESLDHEHHVQNFDTLNPNRALLSPGLRPPRAR